MISGNRSFVDPSVPEHPKSQDVVPCILRSDPLWRIGEDSDGEKSPSAGTDKGTIASGKGNAKQTVPPRSSEAPELFYEHDSRQDLPFVKTKASATTTTSGSKPGKKATAAKAAEAATAAKSETAAKSGTAAKSATAAKSVTPPAATAPKNNFVAKVQKKEDDDGPPPLLADSDGESSSDGGGPPKLVPDSGSDDDAPPKLVAESEEDDSDGPPKLVVDSDDDAPPRLIPDGEEDAAPDLGTKGKKTSRKPADSRGLHGVPEELVAQYKEAAASNSLKKFFAVQSVQFLKSVLSYRKQSIEGLVEKSDLVDAVVKMDPLNKSSPMKPEQPVKVEKPVRECAKCSVSKEQDGYSKNQWGLKGGKPTCKACIEKQEVEEKAQALKAKEASQRMAKALEEKAEQEKLERLRIEAKRREEEKKAAEEAKAPTTKDCSVCKQQLQKESFSAKMWRAKERTCKSCLDEIAREEEEKKKKEEEEEAARRGEKKKKKRQKFSFV